MGGRGGKKKLTTVLYDVKTSGKHILYRQYPKTDDVIDFHVHVTSVIVLHIYSKKKKKIRIILFFFFFTGEMALLNFSEHTHLVRSLPQSI